MTDRLYGAALADFVIAFGDTGFIYEDEDGTPTVTTREGRQVLVPTPAGTSEDPVITVQVYDAKDGTQLTDLLDDQGNAVEELTVPTAWLNLGQILQFTVKDAPDGDVWLTTNAATGPWARAVPFSAEVFQRLTEVEGALSGLELDHLVNVDAEGKQDGDSLRWNNSTGQWEPSTPAGTGTVTKVAGVSPDGDGLISVSALLAALGLSSAGSDLAALKANVKVVRKQTGSGYASKSIFTYAEFQGVATPVTGVVDGDSWLQPASDD